jgi:hypothetical protein
MHTHPWTRLLSWRRRLVLLLLGPFSWRPSIVVLLVLRVMAKHPVWVASVQCVGSAIRHRIMGT